MAESLVSVRQRASYICASAREFARLLPANAVDREDSFCVFRPYWRIDENIHDNIFTALARPGKVYQHPCLAVPLDETGVLHTYVIGGVYRYMTGLQV
jgi:hypothetical protein